MFLHRSLTGLGFGAAWVLVASNGWALDSTTAPPAAQKRLNVVSQQARNVQAIIARSKRRIAPPEKRLADGESMLRSKDYERAISVLSLVEARYTNRPFVAAEARFMLGQAYFESNQLLSARRTFKRVAKDTSPAASRFRGLAFSRLVDISIRTKDFSGLDELTAQIGNSSEPALAYARGKASIVKQEFGKARSALAGVPADHALYHQSKYLLGVVEMQEAESKAPKVKPVPGEAPPPAPPARYAAAVEAFRQVTRLKGDSEEHREVIDFAWLAIGRLFYESYQWLEAAAAYQHVGRKSKHFNTALYELAWVYVRLGDMGAASRALEVLSVIDSDSRYRAKSGQLRADLMLRAGKFKAALKVYESIRAEYSPMVRQVRAFLASTSNPREYYDKLTSERLKIVDKDLPNLALTWAREEEDGPLAFAIIDDINACRALIKRSEVLIMRLRAVLGAPNRVRAFPELKAGDAHAVQLLNQITMARAAIGVGLDDAEISSVSGTLASVRAERRKLQSQLGRLPLNAGDMAKRESSAQRQWNLVSQALQRATLEVDQIRALVNGLEKMLKDGMAGARATPAAKAEWRHQLLTHRAELKSYTGEIARIRRSIEAGRVQVGYGDQRFVEDANLRRAYREKLEEELRLVASGGAGSRAASYASSVSAIMGRASSEEQKLERVRAKIDAQVQERAAQLIKVIQEEAANIVTFRSELAALDNEARDLVGSVAKRNLTRVQDRLKNIVMKADVGMVQQAWEVREEQKTRVRNLKIERANQTRLLVNEMNEVLDDAEDLK